MTVSQITSIINKHQQLIIAGIIATALGVSGWFGYSWYKKRIEQAAHKAFVESVQEYTNMEKNTQEQPAWHDIELALGQRAKEYKSSVLYPYFLMYQADALLKENKTDQAIDIMNNALENISRSLPLYYLYALKRALVKIDSKQGSTRSEGLKELDELSKNTENPLQDMALYYKGYNDFVAGNRTAAEQSWVQLFAPAFKDSVWTQQAQDRLQGLA